MGAMLQLPLLFFRVPFPVTEQVDILRAGDFLVQFHGRRNVDVCKHVVLRFAEVPDRFQVQHVAGKTHTVFDCGDAPLAHLEVVDVAGADVADDRRHNRQAIRQPTVDELRQCVGECDSVERAGDGGDGLD